MGNVGLEFVKTVHAKGNTYLYFNTGERKTGKDGKAGAYIYVRLPAAGSLDFGTRYANLKAIRTKRENRANLLTVKELCDRYQRSGAFIALKPKTQDAYLIYLKRMMRRFTDKKTHLSFPVISVDRPRIRKLLDGIGGGAQMMQLAVLRNVLRYGRKHDLIPETFAPDKGIEIDHEAVPHDPWPESLIELALKDPVMALPVGLLYFTGQRIERITTMRWTDIEDGEVHIPPHKKQGDLYFPVHQSLEAILAIIPKTLTTIICNPDGSSLSTAALRHRIQKWAAEQGHKIKPHGLRKNAVNALLEAGCNAAQVTSITGQSLQMIEHYARKRNNRKMGRAAIAKWQNNV